MKDPENLKPVVDRLMATIAIQGASIEALLLLCRRIAQRSGTSEIDGLPIDDWFQRQKLLQLEDVLIHTESREPGYAALLQSIVDESRSRIDGDKLL
jgi:hypothetical protein